MSRLANQISPKILERYDKEKHPDIGEIKSVFNLFFRKQVRQNYRQSETDIKNIFHRYIYYLMIVSYIYNLRTIGGESKIVNKLSIKMFDIFNTRDLKYISSVKKCHCCFCKYRIIWINTSNIPVTTNQQLNKGQPFTYIKLSLCYSYTYQSQQTKSPLRPI